MEIDRAKLRSCYEKLKNILGSGYHEPFEVVKAVEDYRTYWKPENPKIILLAESHVYTTVEDFRVSLVGLHKALIGYPDNFVRFVYCLGYGEQTILNRSLGRSGGTPQFWKIFYSCLNLIQNNDDFRPILKKNPFDQRLSEKIKLLKEFRARGIWLVDACISGLYGLPGGKPSSSKILRAIQCSWDCYVRDIIEEANPQKIIVIGKGVWKNLSPLLPQNLKEILYCISQPQDRLSAKEHTENFQRYYRLCNSGGKPRSSKKPDFQISRNSPITHRGRGRLAITYSYSRFCFIAEKIEPLRGDECFRIVCPEGTYQMKKAEFYREFSNVIKSKSYKEKGIYHYPKPPRKAYRFLIDIEK